MADRQNIKTDAETLKRYLFYEASESERGQLEARFFDDDELFYELLDLENDLTDRYVRRELGENDKLRFEASLEKSPERRAKLANAVALNTFIEQETPAAKESPTLREKIANFFGWNATYFQYATAALLFLLFAGIGFLIYEQRQDAQELARLRASESERSAEFQRQEQSMQEQIKTIEEREKSLQTELAEKNGRTEILTEQLASEQAEKARLTQELENLKQRKETPVQPFAPTIVTVVLAPIGGKGGGDAAVVSVNQNTATVSATLQIPPDSAAEIFSVRLNSVLLAENIKLHRTKSDVKFVRVVFPSKKLSSSDENLIGVTGGDGSHYNYILRRKK